jgi:hypothetical protein
MPDLESLFDSMQGKVTPSRLARPNLTEYYDWPIHGLVASSRATASLTVNAWETVR